MKRLLLTLSVLLALGLIALAPTLILHCQIQLDYQPEPEEPPIWPIPDDETAARKAVFINMLLPVVQARNRELLAEREQAQALRGRIADGTLTEAELGWLQARATEYRLEAPDHLDDMSEAWLDTLLRRLDIVPADLALAQGALESAWGTSRFAEEANNLFGQWCFRPGCGVVPARRPLGARYEVQKFATVEDAVASYMRNLNTHPTYRELRLLRERQRQEGLKPSGRTLAAGLGGYAEIGDTYIRHIRSVIRANDLEAFSDI
ncbi:glucosaminidase domain-containing protein [Isoalcanivorax indicus]|uniref:glucosaminidase domain-containing protein n=1 Tax=Isoalcanivorax indicus TaxID=2202653 RepID=UPI0013C3E5BD|nr:glucosaminidase domain-containing protein [Isoalcanivorax indicus]